MKCHFCKWVWGLIVFLCLFLRPAGENSQFVEGVVLAGPVPQPVQKAPPRPGNWTHTHASWQLVQEPPAEGSRCVGQKQVARPFHCVEAAEKQPPEGLTFKRRGSPDQVWANYGPGHVGPL